MKMVKRKIFNKVIALVLVMAMIVSVMPTYISNIFAASEGHENVYTLKVMSTQQSAIEGAKVLLKFYKEETTENLIKIGEKDSIELTSGEDGICEITEINDLILEESEVWCKIVSVTADTYETKTDIEPFLINDEVLLNEKNIEMKRVSTVCISGVVKYLDGTETKNLEDAEVSLNIKDSADDTAKKTMKTNSKGEYSFVVEPQKTYTLTISKKGYISEEQNIDLEYEDIAVKDIALTAKTDDETFKFVSDEVSAKFQGEGTEIKVEAGSSKDEKAQIKYEIIKATDLEGQEIAETAEIAEIDSDTGKIKAKKTGKLTVRATYTSDNYNDATAECLVNILKGSMKLKFEKEGSITVTYGENKNQYRNVATIQSPATGEVVYKIKEVKNFNSEIVDNPSDYATITEDSGMIDFRKSCTVTVEAVAKNKDGNYDDKEAVAEYVLQVDKSEQKIAFKEGNQIVYYGEKLQEGLTKTADNVVVENAADGRGYGEGEVIYSIESDEKGILETIDEKTGALTFSGETGTAIIKATKEADDCYKQCQTTYTVEVKNEVFPSDVYHLEGTKGENGWYQGEVKIVPAEGYVISTSNAFNNPNIWSSELCFTEEGIYSNVTFYLKKVDSGAISEVISVDELKIDMTSPSNVVITYDGGAPNIVDDIQGLDSLKESIAFFQNEVQVTLTTTEKSNGSGIDKFEYTYGGQKVSTNNIISREEGEYTVYTTTFSLASQFKGKVTATATDKAGLSSGEWIYASNDIGERTLVVDSQAPQMNVSFTPSTPATNKDNTYYYKEDVALNIKVVEDNFYSQLFSAKINEGDGKIDWRTSDNKIYYGSLLLTTEENQETENNVIINGKDYSGNVAEEYVSPKIIIDKVVPELNVQLSEAVTKDENNKTFYYGKGATIDFSATDKYFDVDGISVVVKKDGKNISNDGVVKIQDISENEKEGRITLSEEGQYQIEIVVTDYAGNQTNKYISPTIIVDHTKPIITQTSISSPQNEKDNIKYYNTDVDLNLEISEVNYFAEDVKIIVEKDGKEIENTTATNNSKFIERKFTENGQYVVIVNYTDRSGNIAETYTSSVIDIQKIKPVIQDKLSANENLHREEEVYYGKDSALFVFTIDSKNFVKENVSVNIKKTDINGVETSYEQSCTFDVESNDDNKHIASIEFTENAKYVVEINYEDANGNKMEKYTSPYIVVDNVAPERKVTLSQPKKMAAEDNMSSIVTPSKDISEEEAKGNIIYYNEGAAVTFEITEVNFFAKDVNIKVVKENGEHSEVEPATEHDFKKDGNKYLTTIKLEDNGSYIIKVEYTDRSGNKMKAYTSPKIIVDDVVASRTVVLSKPEKIADKNNTEIVTVPSESVTEEDANGKILYYKNKMTAVFSLVEENFHGEDVVVSVSKTSYDKLSGQSSTTLKTYTADECGWKLLSADKWQNNMETYEGSIVLEGEGDYEITVSYEDRSGNVMTKYTSPEIIMDHSMPVRSVELTAPVQVRHSKSLDFVEYVYAEEGSESEDLETNKDTLEENQDLTFYYDNDAVYTLNIDEHNFYPEDVNIKINGEKVSNTTDYEFSGFSSDKDIRTGSITFKNDGNYVIEVTYTDRSNNEMKSYVSPMIIVDKTAPDVDNMSVDFKTVAKTETDEGNNHHAYYDSYVEIILTASDETAGIESFNWRYDRETGASETILSEIDNTEISELENGLKTSNIEYTNEGKTASVVVTVPMKEETAEHMIQQLRGNISFTVTDRAHNTSKSFKDNNKTLVVDNMEPVRTIELSKPENVVNISDSFIVTDSESIQNVLNTSNSEDGKNDKILYYREEATAKFRIAEANFYDGDVVVSVTKTSYDKTTAQSSVSTKIYTADECGWKLLSDKENWQNETETYEGSIKLKGDGDYEIAITYEDRSGNIMNAYNSDKIVLSNTKPTREINLSEPVQVRENASLNLVDYTENKGSSEEEQKFSQDELEENKYVTFYYDKAAVYTIYIDEHNFYADDVNIKVNGERVSDQNAAYKFTGFSSDKDIRKASITFNNDGKYVIEVNYTNRSNNEMDSYQSPVLIVDKTAPSVDNMSVSFETKAVTKPNASNNQHAYYNNYLQIKLMAVDVTSGIESFHWSYKREDGASLTNLAEIKEQIVSELSGHEKNKNISYKKYDENGGEIETYFDGNIAFTMINVPLKSSKEVEKTIEQLRGKISFTVTDRAHNTSDLYTDEEKTLVVDNVSPLRKISLSKPNQITQNTKSQETISDSKKVQDILNTSSDENGQNNAILYYGKNAEAVFRITEANFYPGDVEINVKKSQNGVEISNTSYVPEWKLINKKDWVNNTETYEAGIKLAGDGDYVITAVYTDRSGNIMSKYVSDKIVIDTKKPVIKVSYQNKDVKNTIGGTKYYDKNQLAVISITEHNFRAKDIASTITAKDVTGKEIKVTDYAKYLMNSNNWTRKGDVYTATIKYNVDANYTFNIAYKDLALKQAEKYKTDKFTVDKKAPTNLTVSYSANVSESILKNITFGYYNEKVTVTITSKDKIAGINRFVYSYVNSEGVSDVNAELIDEAIKRAEIKQDGYKFTAKFKVPKNALTKKNQFNGNVEFVAYDKSENSKDKASKKRIVVDNIAPTATVEYSQPVTSKGNVDYYTGNIEGTVTVNEANFYPSDCKVMIKMKGGRSRAANVSWTHKGTNQHIGRFTLSGDGDYVVSIDYKDRSGNKMEYYESNQKTIDSKKPTIKVSNIVNNSANKNKVYGFTITANDTNLDSASLKPVLTMTSRDSKGRFINKEIPLSDKKSSNGGHTYSITVNNLETDGLYHLSCTVSDYARNKYSKIALDNGKEYENVNFSINRKGSVFVASDETQDIIDKYYVYNVKQDIVIKEINVDPISKYSIKLNDKVLKEGTDYSTTQTNKNGEWSIRTYTIKKSLFEKEGRYEVIIESVDKTKTNAYSDVKGLDITFVVDKTAPVLTISGLKNQGRYQTKEQTVVVDVSDDGGKPYVFKAIVMDSEGNPLLDASGKDISVRVNLEGGELDEYLEKNDGKIQFTIPEGLENQVKITCGDYVQKIDKIFKKVTVSQSRMVIFYVNKPLLYGCITFIVLILAGIIILVVLKKKKQSTN